MPSFRYSRPPSCCLSWKKKREPSQTDPALKPTVQRGRLERATAAWRRGGLNALLAGGWHNCSAALSESHEGGKRDDCMVQTLLRERKGANTTLFFTHTHTHMLARPCIGGCVREAADWLSTALKLAADGSRGCKASIPTFLSGHPRPPTKAHYKTQSVCLCVWAGGTTQTLAQKCRLSCMFGSQIGPIGPFHNQSVSFFG